MAKKKIQERKPRTSRAEQAAATRTKLTAAALELFARQGYAATSTRQIAELAEVSEGLIFHHFPTKLDLLMTTMSEAEIFANKILDVLSGADDKPIRTQLELIAQSYVSTLSPERKEPQAFRLMLAESLTTPELGTFFMGKQKLVFGTIEHYLGARVAAGELRANLDVQVAARNLMGSFFFFFMSNQNLSPRAWRTKATAYTDELIDFWLRAALARVVRD